MGHCHMTPPRINDPAVRALSNDLGTTFRRMQAIEGRVLSSILTMKEAYDEDVASGRNPHSHEAGSPSEAGPAAPFNAIVAGAVETLRTLRTWP